jgi:transcriptional regulator with XRE-family HTH domain
MSENQLPDVQCDMQDTVALGVSAPRAAMHRLAAVRRAKRVSCYELARLLGTTVEMVRLQEEAADLSISTLNAWAAALNVPVTDLVVDPEEWLPSTDLAKPQAEKLLQLAVKLRDRSRRRSIQRLAQTFVDQLTEMQPALNPAGDGNGNGRRDGHAPLRPPTVGVRTNGKHRNNKHSQPPQSKPQVRPDVSRAAD